MTSAKKTSQTSVKKSKEAQFFKLLRNLAEDLWKVRKGKEKITEEFLADFTKCFEKVAQALPLLDREFSDPACGLIFEMCAELTLLLLDKAFLPVFTRLILAFSKNAENSTSRFCVLKLLTCLDFAAEVENSPTKSTQKEVLNSVKLPKDKEKRRVAKEACISIIQNACKTTLGHASVGSSAVLIKRMMAKSEPEYHNKAPKMMIGQ